MRAQDNLSTSSKTLVPYGSPFLSVALAIMLFGGIAADDNVPDRLRPWLGPQSWVRDTAGPVLSLGPAGTFDDMHIFTPCVALEGGLYRMWYCGSQGEVRDRVFQLGLATSRDGREFAKLETGPVFAFGDGKHSVLTPALLRNGDGSVVREDGKLRMWFSSTHFGGPSDLHTLHEVTSADGIDWSSPSDAQLEHAYAPSVLWDEPTYRMWYTDVSASPWIIRHGQSNDGRLWTVTEEPVLVLDQSWESGRLLYPTVLKLDDVYLMWYGSYWKEHPNKTALGFAASEDGLCWYKSPHNPVFRPDPDRPWESHYTTSQSVLRLPDGSLRMWYATRKNPPFVNKYFAIGTARWSGPNQLSGDGPVEAEGADNTIERVSSNEPLIELAKDPEAFARWQRGMRKGLSDMLGIPKDRVPLEPESRGTFELDGLVIEKWVFTSEPGSLIPAVLYRPKEAPSPMPAVVLTFGHGGSKSHPSYQYLGQLYAKLGVACLAMDPIGEEERHLHGRMGTRAHDPAPVHHRAWNAGRPIMGKLVFDTMRGIDFLLKRDDVDPERIGVAGNSLGGAKAGWMAALDSRLCFAIVSGWAYDDVTLNSKFCTRVPNEHMRKLLSWSGYASLAAPHCALLVMNGDADVIIDRAGDGRAWRGTRAVVDEVAEVYASLGHPGRIRCWFEAGGGHRPYPAHKAGVEWIVEHAKPAGRTVQRVHALPEVSFGRWADVHGVKFEKLYGTDLHLRGATVADMDIRYLTREQLAVLNPEELGQPRYTLEGWLEVIDK
jgi:dienelactone hydrolase